MSLIWQDGQFSWAFVAAVVFLVVLMLASDYLWRTTRVGGKQLVMLAGLSAILGVSAIVWLCP